MRKEAAGSKHCRLKAQLLPRMLLPPSSLQPQERLCTDRQICILLSIKRARLPLSCSTDDLGPANSLTLHTGRAVPASHRPRPRNPSLSIPGEVMLPRVASAHLLGAGGQLHTGDAGIGVVGHDDGVVTGGAGQGTAVTGLLRSATH